MAYLFSSRAMDLSMMTLFNARDRTEDEWAELFELADERFKFLGVKPPADAEDLDAPVGRSWMCLIEARWAP